MRAALFIVFASIEFILILDQESLKHRVRAPNLLWNVVPRTSGVDAISDIAVAMAILRFLITYDRM